MKPSIAFLFARRQVALSILVGVLGLGIAACGSSSSSSSSAVSGTPAASSSSARYQARLNLAKCLRAHGINVPDPNPGGGPAGGGGGGTFRALNSYPQAQVNAARTACQQYFRQAFAFANVSPAQRAQFQQQFVKWAECMRSHGINIPDPTNNGTGGFGLRRTLGSIDRNSPAFQSANTACASVRPRFGGGGAGGPAGGGPGG